MKSFKASTRKEQIQYLVLFVAAVIGVIYALIRFTVVPLRQAWHETSQKLVEAHENLSRSAAEISQVAALEADFANTTNQLQQMIDPYVLKPVLGTYLINLKEAIEEAAARAGFELEGVAEVGTTELPGMTRDKREHHFKAYAVAATGRGSYASLVDMFRKLESGNPLLCITEVNIGSRVEAPEKHIVRFRLELPIRIVGQKPTKPSAPVTPPAEGARSAVE